MRQITDHKIDGVDNLLEIQVLDEPGAGGANHVYQISGTGPNTALMCVISFQNGPIQEVELNGVTQEALIAICMDRLRGFQSGKFACENNAFALEHLELGLGYLQQRTRDRIAREVEGRLVP